MRIVGEGAYARGTVTCWPSARNISTHLCGITTFICKIESRARGSGGGVSPQEGAGPGGRGIAGRGRIDGSGGVPHPAERAARSRPGLGDPRLAAVAVPGARRGAAAVPSPNLHFLQCTCSILRKYIEVLRGNRREATLWRSGAGGTHPGTPRESWMRIEAAAAAHAERHRRRGAALPPGSAAPPGSVGSSRLRPRRAAPTKSRSSSARKARSTRIWTLTRMRAASVFGAMSP